MTAERPDFAKVNGWNLAVAGRNYVQVGLRGYWPPRGVLGWMAAQGMRWHLMREIEERGADAVVTDAIAEVTAAAAHRVVMEALSALAVRTREGHAVRFAGTSRG